MRHIIWDQANKYNTAVLVKGSSFNQGAINTHYVQPLVQQGLAQSNVIAFNLKYDENGKAPVAFIKEYLHKLLPALDTVGVEHIFVTDSNYFKVLTNKTKLDNQFGYVLPCTIKGYQHMNVVLGLNYQQLIYNPQLKAKLDMGIKTLANHVAGTHTTLGAGIVHSAQYPNNTTAIAAALESLHQYPRLTCDIEAFSLRFDEAGLATIAFAWDQHNGIAFACDYKEFIHTSASNESRYGAFELNKEIRFLIKNFLHNYTGELIWHGSAYDLKVLIYTLWMDDYLDTAGLLDGLEILTRNFQDTKIIAYLATNSTAGNVLGLKPLAHEFAGNWAVEDIKDIRKIPLPELLQYNLVDCLSTWYVRDKYAPIMVQDKQEDLYYGLMLPSQKLLLQTELTGMPMSDEKITITKQELTDFQNEQLNLIVNSPLIKVMNLLVQTKAMNTANAKLKIKQHPLEKFSDVSFNPNSGPQLQVLLYEQMGLPVLDLTDTKQPATGAETIEKLINHTVEPAYKELLAALIAYGKVTKILSTFIPAFENGIMKRDGMRYLHGSFKIGGTVSGRLSSAEPNLQNLPAGSDYGKVVKSCFAAPEGWLMAGADFNSLEAMIDALTTKDPYKLGVYTEGYDSHSYNAITYWPEKMPEIADKIDKANSAIEFYLIEYSDGTKEYVCK